MPDKKEKIKLAIARGATCSGCDIALLDLDESILDLVAVADIVYAPTIVDAKDEDVERMKDGEITVCLYHGAVRDSDNEHLAKLMRQKSQILIAYGSCACFGGIPGLANLTNRAAILKTVYSETASTDNPQNTCPSPQCKDAQGHLLTLPELFDEVFSLDDVVKVDYAIPACPPTQEMNKKLLTVLADFVAGKSPLPPKGTIIASEKTLCDECPRKKPDKIVVKHISRVYEKEFDSEKCFLEQGLICLGPATRAGCDAQCIKANMPCRGCMGPTASVIDHGGSMLSALTSILEVSSGEPGLSEGDIERLVNEVKDPLGTFYRFTLPKSLLRRAVKEKGGRNS